MGSEKNANKAFALKRRILGNPKNRVQLIVIRLMTPFSLYSALIYMEERYHHSKQGPELWIRKLYHHKCINKKFFFAKKTLNSSGFARSNDKNTTFIN